MSARPVLCRIPLATGTKAASLIYRWSSLAPDDPIWARTFAAHPKANVGLRLDQFVTADCDSAERVAWWEEHAPPTPFQSRGNRERRTFWYRLADGEHIDPRNHLRLSLEIRSGSGQQCVIPPSIHPPPPKGCGLPYEWLGPPVDEDHFGEIPVLTVAQLAETLAPIVGDEDECWAGGGDIPAPAGVWCGEGRGTPAALRRLERACQSVRCAPPGGSNAAFKDAVHAIAGLAAAGRLDPDSARLALREAAVARGVDPIDSVLRASWRRGFSRPWDPDSPLQVPDPPLTVDNPACVRSSLTHTDERTHAHADPDTITFVPQGACPVYVTNFDPATGRGRSRWVPCRAMACATCRPERDRRKMVLYRQALAPHSHLHVAVVGKPQVRATLERLRRRRRQGQDASWLYLPTSSGTPTVAVMATVAFPGSRPTPLHRAVEGLRDLLAGLPPRTRIGNSADWSEKALKARFAPDPDPEAARMTVLASTPRATKAQVSAILTAHGAVITSRPRDRRLEWYLPGFCDPAVVASLRRHLAEGVVPVHAGHLRRRRAG